MGREVDGGQVKEDKWKEVQYEEIKQKRVEWKGRGVKEGRGGGERVDGCEEGRGAEDGEEKESTQSFTAEEQQEQQRGCGHSLLRLQVPFCRSGSFFLYAVVSNNPLCAGVKPNYTLKHQ